MLLRRRSWILFALIFAAVLGCVLLLNRRGPEHRVYRGKTIRGWVEQLAGPAPAARENAISNLREIGPAAVPGLVKVLHTSEPVIRKRLWPNIARAPKFVSKPLEPFLKPSNVLGLYYAAIQALGELGTNADAAVPELANMFRHGRVGLRYEASVALGKIGGSAVPILLEELNSKNLELRRAAAEALGGPGVPADRVLLPLMNSLSDSNDSVQRAANVSLGRRGPDLLPEVLLLLKSPDPETRRRAAQVLSFFRPNRTMAQPGLLPLLGDPVPACRLQAVRTLGTFSMPNPTLLNAYCAALKDPVPEIRAAAAAALAGSPRLTFSAIPDLQTALRDNSAEVRTAAVRTLAVFGPRASIVLPDLHRLLSDPDPDVRSAADQAIINVEPDMDP